MTISNPTTRDIRVLVLESNQELGSLLSALLHQKGFSIESLGNLETAQNRLDAREFDLIVLEEGRNTVDDLTILHLLSHQFPEVPVVFIAASPQSDAAIGAVLLRIFAVLARPFEVHHLGLVLLGAKAKSEITRPGAISDGAECSIGEAIVGFCKAHS